MDDHRIPVDSLPGTWVHLRRSFRGEADEPEGYSRAYTQYLRAYKDSKPRRAEEVSAPMKNAR